MDGWVARRGLTHADARRLRLRGERLKTRGLPQLASRLDAIALTGTADYELSDRCWQEALALRDHARTWGRLEAKAAGAT
jgi:hypothetical protein